MSLRVFHIVFISVSVLLALYLAVWGMHEFVTSRSTLGIGMVIFGFALGAALVVYGARVFHKLKELP